MRRILAGIIVFAVIVAAMPSMAAESLTVKLFDVGTSTSQLKPEEGLYVFTEISGQIVVQFNLLNNDAAEATVKTTSIGFNSSLFTSAAISGPSKIEATKTATYQAYLTVNEQAAKKLHQTSLTVTVNTNETVEVPFYLNKTSDPPEKPETSTPDTDEPETTPGDVPVLLMLSPVDAYGASVASPMGDAGDTVRMRLPILNRGGYYGSVASQIIVTPEISANLDNFPFVVEAVDYSRGVNDLRPGEIQEITYDFKLSKDAKSGVKEVKFNCVYYNRYKKEYETTKFSVFVTVIKGKEDDDGMTNADGETITTQPKIIIEASSLTPDAPQEGDEEGRLYAGEPFTLKMTIRNTSSEEAVKNIQVTLSNEGNIIIPANNGSNSLYISKIEPNGTVDREVKLQAAPDAEPKSQNLTVKFAYESSKTLKGYTEQQDIAVPILQRVRVRVNDPITYGSGTVDQPGMIEQPVSMSMTVYNLSKSTLYYCTIEVEGEGLRLEEPFYYGNVSGGQSMQADFNIIPSLEGDLEGKIILTFEDAYNKQTRLEKPFTLYIMEDFQGDMGMTEGEFMPPEMMGDTGQGSSVWHWVAGIGGGFAIAGAVIAVITIRKRRRKRELTEDI